MNEEKKLPTEKEKELVSKNHRSPGWGRDLLLVLLGAVLGLVFTVSWEWVEKWRLIKAEEERLPEMLLADAQTRRSRFTESDLALAVETYNKALLHIPKQESSGHDQQHQLLARAYSGLSRTYSDWATLRIRRGLSSDFSERAQGYALKAVTTDPELAESEIALAYTYDSSEAQQPLRAATQAKVNELLFKGTDNLDTQYLAWVSKANDKARSFTDNLHAESIPDLRILLDVALDYAARAAHAQAQEKQKLIGRSEEFLTRAESISQNNPLVLFVRGYLSGAKGQNTEAREYYQKAIIQETAFPLARHNLGFTYVLDRDFRQARKQFKDAVETEGAPTVRLKIWLDSFGEASLELGDNDRACQAWEQAASLPPGNENPMTLMRRAMCAYIAGHGDVAMTEFRRSIQSGKGQGFDPTNPSWLDEQSAGPKVREIVKGLNQMASKVMLASDN